MKDLSMESRCYPGLIAQLKKIKEEKHLTNSDIKDKTDAQNKHPSPSDRTIQKVFAKGSENKKFNYKAALAAITYVLVDQGSSKPFEEAEAPVYYEQVEAFKLLLDEKNAVIAAQQSELAQLEVLRTENALQAQQIEQLSNAKEYVKNQCDRLMLLLENLTEAVKKYKED